jgi:hypothetical protein
MLGLVVHSLAGTSPPPSRPDLGTKLGRDLYRDRDPGPLALIETFVTSCGMVRLAGEGLRSVGVDPSPHPRACALSCPSLAIYGPGRGRTLARDSLLKPAAGQ